jgi:hypothetical protein
MLHYINIYIGVVILIFLSLASLSDYFDNNILIYLWAFISLLFQSSKYTAFIFPYSTTMNRKLTSSKSVPNSSGGSSDRGARGRPCKVGSSLTLMQSGLPKTVPIGVLWAPQSRRNFRPNTPYCRHCRIPNVEHHSWTINPTCPHWLFNSCLILSGLNLLSPAALAHADQVAILWFRFSGSLM